MKEPLLLKHQRTRWFDRNLHRDGFRLADSAAIPEADAYELEDLDAEPLDPEELDDPEEPEESFVPEELEESLLEVDAASFLEVFSELSLPPSLPPSFLPPSGPFLALLSPDFA